MIGKVYLDKDSFDKIKDDNTFMEVVCLARICNLLRFSMYGYLQDTKDIDQIKNQFSKRWNKPRHVKYPLICYTFDKI